MQNLRDTLRDAGNRHVALGHFNFSELVVLKAVADVARELQLPVVVGVSEGERAFVGVRQSAALVKSIRDEYELPIFLNADHTHSLEKSVEAAKAGFDLIVFDASNQPFDENVKRTKEAVEAAKSVNPGILVEGEIGYIGASSTIHSSVPKDLSPLTTPEEAKQFVDATRVDLLAPALGTMHGMLESMVSGKENKHLNIPRIAEIKAATGIFLTLHGGSGTDTAEFVEGIHAGLNLIHINTELRVAWRRGLEQELAKKPDEVTPYHLLPGAYQAVSEVVKSRLQTFSGTSAKEAHS
ncbi:MAG: class II fructose-bisphosphate aldolase [Candidatus Acidiferrum sp.]|jgi:fructose-bisphosphate aldolase class II